VTPASPAFRAILEKFAAEAEERFAAEAEISAKEARAQGERELAGKLNQAARRILQAGTREEVGATAADAAQGFAATAAWLRITDGTAHADALELDVPLSEAAALQHAVETREPVVALAAASELSQALVERVAQPAEDRVLVYPVAAGDGVAAVLCAWTRDAGGAVNPALELLAQCAAAAWQRLEPPPAPPPSPPQKVVSIAPAAAAPKAANAWESLSADEQQMHLRAQRYARVQVAEMRLASAAAVKRGRTRRDLYGELREPVNAARDAFRKQFFAKCPSMVDYLHLELVKTLANDDADALGKDYPGPMV
jgi:hypothetical protein